MRGRGDFQTDALKLLDAGHVLAQPWRIGLIEECWELFNRCAERFKLMVRVTRMNGLALVAGELHPQFRGNARIRQRGRKGVAKGVEGAP